MMRQTISAFAAAVFAASIAAPLQAAGPDEALLTAEPIRWVLDDRGAVAPAGAEQEAMLLQLASIARHNEIAVSITAAEAEQAFALAEGLQARGVPPESIGIALRDGPDGAAAPLEVLLEVVEVGSGPARLQWAADAGR